MMRNKKITSFASYFFVIILWFSLVKEVRTVVGNYDGDVGGTIRLGIYF
jgi:hypothetical protein